ncbi:MAG: hypothetical protein IVW57_04835 [Ktedonobacterales bacterium]|nr:hypothetical protein [Ktedonobacterales bacterium]
MLEQLRGRNLAHVGCTLGLTVGLVVGLIAAVIIVQLGQTDAAANWATFIWLGTAFALGALGFVLGGRVSRRLWGSDAPSE